MKYFSIKTTAIDTLIIQLAYNAKSEEIEIATGN
jgi:hypothetical protein